MSKKWYYFYVLLLFFALFCFTYSVFAGETKKEVYPTMPNSTVRDYSKPVLVTVETKNKVVVYQTLPNSSVRDYSAPTYVYKKK